MIQIAIINACTVLSDATIKAAVPALQRQVLEHFEPLWGVDAHLTFVPKGGSPAPGSWWIAILDSSDVAGALGYHDLTSESLPIGKVFAGTDQQYGLSWTVTLSHELLEMLADPYINLAAEVETSRTGQRWYAYEVCDACEADALGYTIDGVLVSDFVTPEWFEAMPHPAGTTFDYKGHLTKPFQLAPGGYISVLASSSRRGWTQLYAETAKTSAKFQYQTRPKVGSRRERRALPKEEWIPSTVHSQPKETADAPTQQ